MIFIYKGFGEQGGAVAVTKGKGKGKKELVDFVVQYAKSGRAACAHCSEKILKVIYLF